MTRFTRRMRVWPETARWISSAARSGCRGRLMPRSAPNFLRSPINAPCIARWKGRRKSRPSYCHPIPNDDPAPRKGQGAGSYITGDAAQACELAGALRAGGQPAAEAARAAWPRAVSAGPEVCHAAVCLVACSGDDLHQRSHSRFGNNRSTASNRRTGHTRSPPQRHMSHLRNPKA